MSTIGVTGHSNLTEPTRRLVYAAIRAELDTRGGSAVRGVTCLARGADQVFAQVIVDLGGELEVVLPAEDYRDNVVKAENLAAFDRLLGAASTVTMMKFPTSNRDAYVAAGEEVLTRSDALIAVWDGAPPDGRGGTADVVEHAQSRGLPVVVVWPEGSSRA